MENNNRNREREKGTDNDFNIGEMLLRVLITAIVVAIAAFFTVKSIILCKILYNVLPVTH